MSSDIEHGPCDSLGEPVILGWQAEPAVFGWQARARRPRTASLPPATFGWRVSGVFGRRSHNIRFRGGVVSPANPEQSGGANRLRSEAAGPEQSGCATSSIGGGDSEAIRRRHLSGGLETHNRSIVRSRKAAATRWFASESGIGRSRWAQPTTGPARTLACRPDTAGATRRRWWSGAVKRRSEVYGSHARRPASRLAGEWDTPRRPACRGMGDARRPGNGSPVTDGQCASAGGPATGRRRRLAARQRDGSGGAQLQHSARGLGNGSEGGVCQAPGLGKGSVR